MDRPAFVDGRSFAGPDEAIVNVELAALKDIAVGDVVPVAFWSPLVEFGEPDMVQSPEGVEHLTVVGIATLPDEVLPDELYPRFRMIVSPDVADRYDCMPDVPPRDAGFEEVLAVLVPEGCALSYRYYSLEMRDGEAGVAPALEPNPASPCARRSRGQDGSKSSGFQSLGSTSTSQLPELSRMIASMP